jgi:hypothetical protein
MTKILIDRATVQQALEALGGELPGWRTPAQERAITALKAALEQPVQEPVATVAMDVSRAHISWDGKYLGQRPDMKIAMLLKDLPVGTLLYAHPPRREWRGLTEEEIYPLYSEPSSDAEMVEFARAIEAALKEKNT